MDLLQWPESKQTVRANCMTEQYILYILLQDCIQTINNSTEIDAGLLSIIHPPNKTQGESRSCLTNQWFQLHQVTCIQFCLHWVSVYTDMFTRLSVQALHVGLRIYDSADPRGHGRRIKFMSCSPSIRTDTENIIWASEMTVYEST